MQSTAVTSSNIDTIGHDSGTLFIRFKSGVSYAYAAVPEGVFTALSKAESVGSFFHRFVKSKYPTTRLDDDPFISTTKDMMNVRRSPEAPISLNT